MKTTVLAFWICLIPVFICAQGKYELGFFVGGSTYYGDLAPTSGIYFEEMQFSLGITNRFKLANSLNLRANLLYGQISGADANFENISFRERRNAAFESSYFEGALQLEWEFLALAKSIDSLGNKKGLIAPYLFGGIGLVSFSPKILSEEILELPEMLMKDLDTDFSTLGLSIPFGGGIKFALGDFVNLRLESGLHYTNTDFLDGISFAGNPDTKDWIWTFGANLGFTFSPKDSDKDGVPDKDDQCPFVKGKLIAKGCPDEDEDGVEDAEDLCPDQPGLYEMNGCPDTDGDDIPDILDDCPEEYGFEDTNGCPDGDNDCVIDSEDKCPDLAGLAIWEGCTDQDNDSIPDHLDLCPTEIGLTENDGCPLLDADCDGILDRDDRCPDIASTEGFTGCPDEDEDNVPDTLDKCPLEAGPADNYGCPILDDEAFRILTTATTKIKFRSGRSSLISSSKKTLDEVAELMKSYPNYQLKISGFTDNQGAEASNLKLSKARAKTCYEYIIGQGIAPDRMSYNGYGEANPVGDNKTSVGRELNRRVEFEMELNIEQ